MEDGCKFREPWKADKLIELFLAWKEAKDAEEKAAQH